MLTFSKILYDLSSEFGSLSGRQSGSGSECVSRFPDTYIKQQISIGFVSNIVLCKCLQDCYKFD